MIMHIPIVSTPTSDYTQELTSGTRKANITVETRTGVPTSEHVASSDGIDTTMPVDTLSLRQSSSISTETHEEKLARLQTAIDNGTYHISSSVLADKLIKAGVITRD